LPVPLAIFEVAQISSQEQQMGYAPLVTNPFRGAVKAPTERLNPCSFGVCAVTGSDQDHLLPIYKNVPAMQGLMGFQIEPLEMMQKVNGGGSWRVL
jgi:hypothetical protein